MRSDMAKVIVERPRHGSRQRRARAIGNSGSDLRRRIFRNAKACSLTRDAPNGLASGWDRCESICKSKSGGLGTCVFSEICAHLRCDSVIQSHVRDHLLDFIIVDVVEIDGTPCYGDGRRYAKPLQFGYWTFLYVCPRTGLVRRIQAGQAALAVESHLRQRRPAIPPSRRALVGSEASSHAGGCRRLLGCARESIRSMSGVAKTWRHATASTPMRSQFDLFRRRSNANSTNDLANLRVDRLLSGNGVCSVVVSASPACEAGSVGSIPIEHPDRASARSFVLLTNSV